MAVPTAAETLDALRTAEFEIVTRGAASYSVNGRSFTALSLKDLREAITYYEAQVSAATGERMFKPLAIGGVGR